MKKSTICLISVGVIMLSMALFATNNLSSVDITYVNNYFLGINLWYWDTLMVILLFIGLFFVYKEEKEEKNGHTA